MRARGQELQHTGAGLLTGGISVGFGAGRMPRRNPEKRELQRETFQKCVLAESYQPELGEYKVRFQKASGEEAGRTFQHCRCTAGNPESSSSSCLGDHRGLPIKPWGGHSLDIKTTFWDTEITLGLTQTEVNPPK